MLSDQASHQLAPWTSLSLGIRPGSSLAELDKRSSLCFLLKSFFLLSHLFFLVLLHLVIFCSSCFFLLFFFISPLLRLSRFFFSPVSSSLRFLLLSRFFFSPLSFLHSLSLSLSPLFSANPVSQNHFLVLLNLSSSLFLVFFLRGGYCLSCACCFCFEKL